MMNPLCPPLYIPPSIISYMSPQEGHDLEQGTLCSRDHPKSSDSLRLSADSILEARAVYYSLKGNLGCTSLFPSQIYCSNKISKLILAIMKRISFFLNLSTFVLKVPDYMMCLHICMCPFHLYPF